VLLDAPTLELVAAVVIVAAVVGGIGGASLL
jgi:hypothetical protein